MAKQILDLRAQLRQYKYNYDILQNIDCTKKECQKFKKLIDAEQPLPEDIIKGQGELSDNEFYRVYETDLTDEELSKYLTYKQLELLKTIKGYLLFFVVLAVIGIITSLLFALMN